MITNFKIFEKNNLFNCTALISRLRNLMEDIGYNVYGNSYGIEVFKDEKYIFAIVHRQISKDDIVAFKNSSDKTTNVDISDYLIEYLQTIDGLEYDDIYYDGFFMVVGNIDGILSQIDTSDFEIFIQSKKYNL